MRSVLLLLFALFLILLPGTQGFSDDWTNTYGQKELTPEEHDKLSSEEKQEYMKYKIYAGTEGHLFKKSQDKMAPHCLKPRTPDERVAWRDGTSDGTNPLRQREIEQGTKMHEEGEAEVKRWEEEEKKLDAERDRLNDLITVINKQRTDLPRSDEEGKAAKRAEAAAIRAQRDYLKDVRLKEIRAERDKADDVDDMGRSLLYGEATFLTGEGCGEEGGAGAVGGGDTCAKYPDLCRARGSVDATGGGDQDSSLAKKLGLAEMPSWEGKGRDDCTDSDSGELKGDCGKAPEPGKKAPTRSSTSRLPAAGAATWAARP